MEQRLNATGRLVEVACTVAVAWFTVEFYRAATARQKGLDTDFMVREATHKKMVMYRKLAHWAGCKAIESERKYWELTHE